MTVSVTNIPSSRRRLNASRRAAVLVLILGILALLSLLAFGLAHRVRLELKIEGMHKRQAQARYLALGGIARAMAALREDADEALDHFGEPWHLVKTAAEEGVLLSARLDGSDSQTAGPSLSYAVLDEESRLNINTSSPAAWLNLDGLDESTICAIVDWQDEDDVVTGSGVESVDYERQSEPYRAKNEPLSMIWELGLIRGVSKWSLLGEDVNGNLMIDANENDGSESWPVDNADSVLNHGLIDLFTVYGSGKINLNTAGEQVLSALPDIGPEAARALVDWRLGPDRHPFTSDDRFLATLEQVAEIPGLTEHQATLLREYGTVHSTHFRIYVQAAAMPGSKPCRLMALVRREHGELKLVWVKTLA